MLNACRWSCRAQAAPAVPLSLWSQLGHHGCPCAGAGRGSGAHSLPRSPEVSRRHRTDHAPEPGGLLGTQGARQVAVQRAATGRGDLAGPAEERGELQGPEPHPGCCAGPRKSPEHHPRCLSLLEVLCPGMPAQIRPGRGPQCLLNGWVSGCPVSCAGLGEGGSWSVGQQVLP